MTESLLPMEKKSVKGIVWIVAFGIILGILPLFLKPMIFLAAAPGLFLCVVVMRNPRIGLLLTALTIPLEMAGRIVSMTEHLPLTIPKLMTFLTLLSFLVHYATRKIRIKRLPLINWLFVFLGAAIISLIGAPEIKFGIEAIFRLCTTILFFFLVVQLVDSKEFMKKCLIGFVLAVTLAAGYGILQRFMPQSRFEYRLGWEEKNALRFGVEQDITEEHMVGIVGRSSGLSGHSIVLALNVALVLSLAVAFFSNLSIRNPARSLWLLVIAILLSAVIVTYSRTGFILIIFSFTMIFLRRLLRFNTVIIVFGILAITIALVAAPKGYIERVLDPQIYTMKSRSIATRVAAQHAMSALFLDHPLFGIGYGNRFSIFDYYKTYPDKKHSVTPHQAYLQMATQTGIVGLSVLVIFFIQLHWHTRKSIMRFRVAGDMEMTKIGEALNISVLTFLFSGLALDLFDKGMAHAWLLIGMSGAYIVLSMERALSDATIPEPEYNLQKNQS